MTPREKARELIDKMYYCQRYVDGENYIPLEAYKRAKQCTLIAVNEIINTDCLIDEDVYVMTPSYIQHWQEVKKELNNL